MAHGAHAEEPGEHYPELQRPDRESVGQRLAQARLDLGQDLPDVSTNLRIRRVYLQAIEEGRYAELPGATYAVGFVRSYADYLGLDSDFLVERFKQEIAGLERRQQLHFPAPKPEGRIPGGALVLVSLLLIGIAYGAWSYASNDPGMLDGLLPREAGGPTADVPTADVPAAPETQTAAAPAREGPAETASRTAAPRAAPAAAPAAAPTAAPTAAPAAAPDAASDRPGDVQVFTERMESAAAAAGEDLAETPQPPMGATPVAPPPAEARPVQTGTRTGAQTARVTEDTGAAEPAVAGEAARGPAPADAAAPAPAAPAVPAPEVPAPATAETAAPAEVAAQNAERPAARPADAAAGETADAAPAEGAAGAAADTAGEAAGQTAPSDIAAAATESIEADIPAAPDIPTQVAATGRVYGAVNEDSRITLTATADSWVQVRSAEGNLLITRVLREGDVYRAPNRDGLVLETGNAGGLRITVDGRPAPQLGRPGDVVRGISLEPEALLAGRAVR